MSIDPTDKGISLIATTELNNDTTHSPINTNQMFASRLRTLAIQASIVLAIAPLISLFINFTPTTAGYYIFASAITTGSISFICYNQYTLFIYYVWLVVVSQLFIDAKETYDTVTVNCQQLVGVNHDGALLQACQHGKTFRIVAVMVSDIVRVLLLGLLVYFAFESRKIKFDDVESDVVKDNDVEKQ